jgi:hypothetical protein
MTDLDLTTCRAEFEAASRKLCEAYEASILRERAKAFSTAPAALAEAVKRLRNVAGSYYLDDCPKPNNDLYKYVDDLKLVAAAYLAATAAPSPPEIVLPKVDADGDYIIGTGGVYGGTVRRDAWFASRGRGDWICDAAGNKIAFDTTIDAARALAALGEGPGATP